MAIQETEIIWHNGDYIGWADAQIHVLSHALHYGTSFFEGIRVYDTPSGPCGFRLFDHMQRLIDSARIYDVALDYDASQLVEASKELVRRNKLSSAYIRPIAFMGYGSIGVVPTDDTPVELYMATFPWGAYLGSEALENGVDVCVSSWNRVAPNTVPTGAKAGGNYLSSYLISKEAKTRGFSEGIALGPDGRLSEGAGENLFVIKDGKLMTPPAASSILMGITRDTIIALAKRRGIEVVEASLPREILYLCDEAFLTGTAAELTPIRSVDGRKTRAAGPGEITKMLQSDFFGLFNGQTKDEWGWLDPIHAASATVQEAEMKKGKKGTLHGEAA